MVVGVGSSTCGSGVVEITGSLTGVGTVGVAGSGAGAGAGFGMGGRVGSMDVGGVGAVDKGAVCINGSTAGVATTSAGAAGIAMGSAAGVGAKGSWGGSCGGVGEEPMTSVAAFDSSASIMLAKSLSSAGLDSRG